jgi:hypothetical protein
MVASISLAPGAGALLDIRSKIGPLFAGADAGASRPVELPAAGGSARDVRIDFLRGLALLFIFVDHIPLNPLSAFTLQALGLSDAAEAFVFMSGIVCGAAYSKTLLARGWGAVWGKVLKRCGQLYVANLVMLGASVAVAAAWHGRGPHGGEYDRFFTDTAGAVRDAVMLRFAPGLMQVLNLYMIMLLVLPAGLWLLHGRGGRGALVVASLAIYAAAQCSLIRLPYGWGSWNFNPLAWQVLFFAGVSLYRRGPAVGTSAPVSRRAGGGRLAWAAVVALVAICMAMHVEPVWGAGGPRASLSVCGDRVFAMSGKRMLEPVRAAHFLLVAYACGALLPRRSAMFDGVVGRALVVTGRHSLPVFCLGGVLSYAAGFVVDRAGLAAAAFVAVNVCGGVMLVMFARGLEAAKGRGRGVRAGGGA